jgi:2-oxoglutarate dehydrogenase E2 component (dihydrolipoamide succinyltransferase)
MPQMGESVAEGTIVRWLKKIGDPVERDEPLFEISTDKVDAEIPSPIAGVVSEIRVKEGETVPINTVVGIVDEGGAAVSATKPASTPAAPGAVAAAAPKTDTPVAQSQAPAQAVPGSSVAPLAPPAPLAPAAPVASVAPHAPVARPAPPVPGSVRPWSAAEARALRLSPVVRKIARDHHIDVRNIAGSGSRGRVTKSDILAYIDAGAPVPAASAAGAPTEGRPEAPFAPAAADLLARLSPSQLPADSTAYERVPMSVMRRKIAEHMVLSRRTSPHVHSAFEIDFTKVDEIRKARKTEYENAGGKLTYMSFITKACADALKAVPIVNSSVDGIDIIYRKEINVGVAVALDWGLIVPVVKNADRMSLLEISKAIADLAGRAREKKLKPEEVQGGTFTITNPGVFGALFGMPIINQPQVAIVGVGAVEKRPVALTDAVTIRTRAYLTIGYDHRVIDGAVADQFMQHVKKRIESWEGE